MVTRQNPSPVLTERTVVRAANPLSSFWLGAPLDGFVRQSGAQNLISGSIALQQSALKNPSDTGSYRNLFRSSELLSWHTNGAKLWVSEKVHYCGYWVYRSQSLSCLLFLCITDYSPAEGLKGC